MERFHHCKAILQSKNSWWRVSGEGWWPTINHTTHCVSRGIDQGVVYYAPPCYHLIEVIWAKVWTGLISRLHHLQSHHVASTTVVHSVSQRCWVNCCVYNSNTGNLSRLYVQLCLSCYDGWTFAEWLFALASTHRAYSTLFSLCLGVLFSGFTRTESETCSLMSTRGYTKLSISC